MSATEANEITVHGTWQDRFEPVVNAFRTNFAASNELGASFSLVQDGEVCVDIWGGHLDEAKQQPWQEDSIVNVYSTTKTMAALCALVLADRGELDFAAPVATYWPEFAAAGKERVLVSHLLAHSAGLSGFGDEPFGLAEVCDHDRCAEQLARQTPWWEPGTASGYHAITQGYLVGEVVRRVTGQSLGQWFAQNIAGPLGADFHIGLPEQHFARVGDLVPPPSADLGAGLPGDSVAARTFANPAVNALDSRTPQWRKAEIPAANGHGNARSVARIQGVLAAGGSAFGLDLLSEAGARKVLEQQVTGPDLVLGVPLSFGLGYGLCDANMPISPNANSCFWGGWGGSTIVVDFDAGMAFSYVMNRMGEGALGDDRGARLNRAVYEALAG